MDTENWYHAYSKIGVMKKKKIDIMDNKISFMATKKLVSWIRKYWYHEYGKIGMMDT